MPNLADTTLDLNDQAWSVLKALAAKELAVPYQFSERTCAFYNGRERGMVLMVNPVMHWSSQLKVAWAEHRNSDNIVVYHWISDSNWNPPNGDDAAFDKAGFENAKYLSPGAFEEAASYIATLAQDFMLGEVLTQ